MDKRELYLFLLFICLFGAVNNSFAQSSASAFQRVEMIIQPRIEFSSLKPAEVNLSVTTKTTADNYSQQFRVRSNTGFMVSAGSNDVLMTGDGGDKTFAVNYKMNRKRTATNQTTGRIYTATAP
jgi:hypothetical protein